MTDNIITVASYIKLKASTAVSTSKMEQLRDEAIEELGLELFSNNDRQEHLRIIESLDIKLQEVEESTVIMRELLNEIKSNITNLIYNF